MNTLDLPSRTISREMSVSNEIRNEQRWAEAGENLAVLNFSEKIIEEKERHLRECIANNYTRIKDVERELSGLQMQLKLSTGPKKSALMMMRKKIELQNDRVLHARERQRAAKKVFEATDESLREEERAKERLCEELNMLVQQSASAQLEKLEQLTERLERMNRNVGLGTEDSEAPEHAAAAKAVMAALRAVPPPTAREPAPEAGGGTDAAASSPPSPFLLQQQEAGGGPGAPQQQPQEQAELRKAQHHAAAAGGQQQAPKRVPAQVTGGPSGRSSPAPGPEGRSRSAGAGAMAAAARGRHASLTGARASAPPAHSAVAPGGRAGPFQGFDA